MGKYGTMLAMLILTIIYWLTTIGLLIAGIVTFSGNEETAKKMLIASGVMFLIGGGICRAIL